MNPFDILNSKLLFILVLSGLLIIFVMCLFFFNRARKKVKELGVSKQDFNDAMKSSVVFSIVPSISVIIGLISLAPLLGTPWAWFRLSVVGSLGYELMAADLAVKGAGYESLAQFSQTGLSSDVGVILFVMSISIMAGMLFNVFGLKPIHKKLSQGSGKQDKFKSFVTSSLTIGMMSVFVPMQFIASKIHAITLIASAILTLLLGKLSRKHPWISDYIMSFALIFGMTVAVVASNIVG